MPDATTRLERYGPAEVVLLLVLASMWGLSFLFVEVAVTSVAPLWIVSIRTAIGGLVLLVATLVTRTRLPRTWTTWRHLAVLAVLNNAVPWTAIAWAQQTIPSGLTALLMALVPTSTLAISVLVGLERFTLARLIGLIVSLSGVVAIVLDDMSSPGRILSIAAVVLATMLYALSGVYAKRILQGPLPPLTIATGQVLCASAVTMTLSLLFAPIPDVGSLTWPVIASLGSLGVFGTGVAYIILYALIDRVGPTNTSMVAYLIPVVAVIAGVAVLGERLGLRVLVGGGLVIAGIWLSQRTWTPSTIDHLEQRPR
ncbi:MAG: DMT family transporter [Nitriliruptoraceae bacterium]